MWVDFAALHVPGEDRPLCTPRWVGGFSPAPWKPLSHVFAGQGVLNTGALGLGLPRALRAASDPPPRSVAMELAVPSTGRSRRGGEQGSGHLVRPGAALGGWCSPHPWTEPLWFTEAASPRDGWMVPPGADCAQGSGW